MDRRRPTSRAAAAELYWIPLGAGGHSVRFNGRVYEAVDAARRHRARCDLYHAALVVELNGDPYTIEVAPSPDADEASRGVVGTGAVGSRYAGWLRLFRYEVRCSRGGSIPDLGEAVGAPCRLTSDPRVARRLHDLVPSVPTPVWGRDELDAGEMWNSNSVVAWLIVTAGLSPDGVQPPPGGRAPGWSAGVEVARRVPVVPAGSVTSAMGALGRRIACLLALGARSRGRGSGPGRHAGVAAVLGRGLLGVRDGVMRQLDGWWRPAGSAYLLRGASSVRVNRALLLAHSIAAREGHEGPTRHDARARAWSTGSRRRRRGWERGEAGG